MADTIGTAYVQIEPSFDGVVPKIDKEFGGAGEKSGKSFGQGFAKVAGGVGKVALAAVGTAAAGITALTKQAVSSYADYEQLVGGVETLFDASANIERYKGVLYDMGYSAEEVAKEIASIENPIDTVMNNAAKAYQTAGLSANKYMEIATSMAAALNQATGDQAESAEYVDLAIIDMADNANKMGTAMESIQNAYSGFSKQNYTMLDNLKLGYGGTKEEMKRLLEDAGKLADTEFSIDNYADVVEAIHVIQTEMGITGTTAKEASTTIQGSLASIKGAWENLLVAMTSGDDLGSYIDNLVATLSAALSNLMPAIQQSLQGIGSLLIEIAPIITSALPELVNTLLPPLIDAAISIVEGLVAALPSILQTIVSILPGLVNTICQILITNLPMLLDVALQAIVTLASGIAQSLPTLIPQIVEVVMAIVDTLVNNIDMLIDVAIQLIMALVDGVVAATPILIEKFPEIILKIWDAIIRNLPKILQAAVELIMTLIKGIANNYAKVFEVGKQIIEKVKGGFMQQIESAKTWGKDMIQKFIDGILAKWNDLKSSVANVAQSVKDFLGFSEPDKGPLSNFHTYAPDMMDLFSKGIKDNSYKVTDALADVGADMMDTNVNVNHMVSSDFATRDNDNTVSIGGAVAAAVRDALIGMGIYMDSQQVGAMVAQPVNNALGRIATRGIAR